MKVKVSRVRKINSSFPKVAVLYRDSCNEVEHFPYKNLRHTMGCCIERRYGEYSEENKKRFEQELELSDGCLDNLSGVSGLFLISLKDLVTIYDYCFSTSGVPSEILFCWIRMYVKEYVLC